MKKKNKIKKFPWEKTILKCDQLHCDKEGNYQAPKSINSSSTSSTSKPVGLILKLQE